VVKRFLVNTIKGVGRHFGLEISRLASTIGVMEAFLGHLQAIGFKPTRVLDVGANRADWSRMAQKFFPGAKFILIEPQSEMISELKSFCAEAPGSEWKLAGAGSAPGEMKLTVWPDNAQSSLMFQPEGNGFFEHRSVPIITIDSLFDEQHELPQLAKLDIQGFELEALRGAAKLFRHTECFIVEVNLFKRVPDVPLISDVISFFDQRGYKVYDIPGELRRPLDNALWQVDLAFVQKGGRFDTCQRWQK
jgi:FkbM family methyltransferase